MMPHGMKSCLEGGAGSHISELDDLRAVVVITCSMARGRSAQHPQHQLNMVCGNGAACGAVKVNVCCCD